MFRLIAAVALVLATPGVALAQDPHGVHAGHQPSDPHAGMDHSAHAGHGNQAAPGVVTVPADGAMLMGPPATFSITFAHPMRLIGLSLQARGQAVVTVPVPEAPVANHTSVALPSLSPANYALIWTAQGEDGHEMTGAVQFMVH